MENKNKVKIEDNTMNILKKISMKSVYYGSTYGPIACMYDDILSNMGRSAVQYKVMDELLTEVGINFFAPRRARGISNFLDDKIEELGLENSKNGNHITMKKSKLKDLNIYLPPRFYDLNLSNESGDKMDLINKKDHKSYIENSAISNLGREKGQLMHLYDINSRTEAKHIENIRFGISELNNIDIFNEFGKNMVLNDSPNFIATEIGKKSAEAISKFSEIKYNHFKTYKYDKVLEEYREHYGQELMCALDNLVDYYSIFS